MDKRKQTLKEERGKSRKYGDALIRIYKILKGKGYYSPQDTEIEAICESVGVHEAVVDLNSMEKVIKIID